MVATQYKKNKKKKQGNVSKKAKAKALRGGGSDYYQKGKGKVYPDRSKDVERERYMGSRTQVEQFIPKHHFTERDATNTFIGRVKLSIFVCMVLCKHSWGK